MRLQHKARDEAPQDVANDTGPAGANWEALNPEKQGPKLSLELENAVVRLERALTPGRDAAEALADLAPIIDTLAGVLARLPDHAKYKDPAFRAPNSKELAIAGLAQALSFASAITEPESVSSMGAVTCRNLVAPQLASNIVREGLLACSQELTNPRGIGLNLVTAALAAIKAPDGPIAALVALNKERTSELSGAALRIPVRVDNPGLTALAAFLKNHGAPLLAAADLLPFLRARERQEILGDLCIAFGAIQDPTLQTLNPDESFGDGEALAPRLPGSLGRTKDFLTMLDGELDKYVKKYGASDLAEVSEAEESPALADACMPSAKRNGAHKHGPSTATSAKRSPAKARK